MCTIELEPPWARFPDYEHLCLGWRMGAGESYLGEWWRFLESVPLAKREAYLGRHPAAPHTWHETVWAVLGEEEAPEGGLQSLIDRELVGSDVAYPTWKRCFTWPWELTPSLITTARYDTRRFAFLSRALVEDRRQQSFEGVRVPWRWRAVTQAIRTGTPGRLTPKQGLKTLGVLLCAGEVAGPWTLGMKVSDFEDTFESTMNYADAFRLWMMSVFDDRPHYERELDRLGPPADWRAWMDSQTYLPSA